MVIPEEGHEGSCWWSGLQQHWGSRTTALAQTDFFFFFFFQTTLILTLANHAKMGGWIFFSFIIWSTKAFV